MPSLSYRTNGICHYMWTAKVLKKYNDKPSLKKNEKFYIEVQKYLNRNINNKSQILKVYSQKRLSQNQEKKLTTKFMIL